MSENTTITRCEATTCQHNNAQQCTADKVQITVSGGEAKCSKYTLNSDTSKDNKNS